MKVHKDGTTPKEVITLYDTDGNALDPSSDVDKIEIYVYNVETDTEIGSWTSDTTDITAVSEGAAVAGEATKASITAASHGLSEGDSITIKGTSNYNGTTTVLSVTDANNFEIDVDYTADESPVSAYFIDGDFDYKCDVDTENVTFIFSISMTTDPPRGDNRVDIVVEYNDATYPDGKNVEKYSAILNKFIDSNG